MSQKEMLILDGFANVLLGLVLLLIPATLLQWLGFAVGGTALLSILGSIIFAIGIALLFEAWRKENFPTGLGLTGAMVINFCFGIALGGWLLFGGLQLNSTGSVLLWVLTVILVLFSAVELFIHLRLHT